MERNYETARETAIKIRKVLKERYPNTKFSVKSSTYSMGSSVTVTYKEGEKPGEEIHELIRGFSSSSFDGMDDSTTIKGYEYEGKRYYGADYVHYSRS